jgi:hypothetical protein
MTKWQVVRFGAELLWDLITGKLEPKPTAPKGLPATHSQHQTQASRGPHKLRQGPRK